MKRPFHAGVLIVFLVFIGLGDLHCIAEEVTFETDNRQQIDGFGYTLDPMAGSEGGGSSQLVKTPCRYLALPLDLVTACPEQSVRNLPSSILDYLKDGRMEQAKKEGITDVVLMPQGIPDYMLLNTPTPAADGDRPLNYEFVPKYAFMVADFVAKLRTEQGVPISAVSVAARTVHITPDQWQLIVKYLRQVLDARGMQAVKILAVDWPANDPGAVVRLDSIKQDADAWRAVGAILLESSMLTPTPDFFQSYSVIDKKDLWMTQGTSVSMTTTNGGQAASMLSSLNRGAAVWIADGTMSAAAIEIAKALPQGSMMHQTGEPSDARICSAAGIRPDGSYVVAITRATSSDGHDLTNSEVQLKIPVLASKGDVNCTIRSIPLDGSNIQETPAVLHQGAARFNLPDGETAIIEIMHQ